MIWRIRFTCSSLLEKSGFPPKDFVCKLNKSVYGLPQSSCAWNARLKEILIGLNFERSSADPCVYVREGILLAVYVDDLLLLGAKSAIESLKIQLAEK